MADIVQRLRIKFTASLPAAGFDTRFYKSSYVDIASMSDADARRHYQLHGRGEGRHGSLRQLIRSLEAEHGKLASPLRLKEYRTLYPDLSKRLPSDVDLVIHFFKHARADGHFASHAEMLRTLTERHGPLPADFDVAKYRQLNPDLASDRTQDIQYIMHFLECGRAEGRPYSDFHPTLYRALYRPDWPLDHVRLKRDWREHASAARFATWSDMLETYGFKFGAWIDLVKLAEFKVLNAAWAGDVQNKEQALLAFVKEGYRRLAPLYLGGDFDPAYYLARHPDLAEMEAPALYRHWLLNGAADGEPPSPRAHLTKLKLSDYPDGFPWGAYVAQFPAAGPDRWSALEHFITEGFRNGGVTAPSAEPQLLLAIADAASRSGADGGALRAYDAAQRLSPLTPDARQHLGDAYLRLGLWEAAAREYGLLLEAGDSSLWTILNAATCALKLGDPGQALEVLALGKAEFSGDHKWLAKLSEAIEADFNRHAFQARDLYHQDRVIEGDRVLALAVQGAAAQLSELAPLGVAVPASADGRIVILANQDLRQCTHYRVEQKAELLDALKRPHEIFSPAQVVDFTSALAGASAAIFYRVPAFPYVIKAILTARALGIPTYYEIDDFVFDSAVYPPPIETYGGLLSKAAYDSLRFGTPLFRAAMALCDYGIASTEPLARQIEPVVRTGQCFVVKNGLDSHNQDLVAPPGADDKPTIDVFYGSGTLAHNSDFLDMAGPALLDLLAANPRVRLVIIGHLALSEDFARFDKQIVRHDFVPNAAAYWALLAKADINLAVLLPDAMTDCKSEIKWLEAAVFEIPSIVSPTAAYRDVLEDGVDVLMAATPQAWAEALNRLVDDPVLRRRIGAQARAKAFARYSIQAGAQSLQLALDPADATRISRPKVKPRLLIVNVYFPPQTIGGATRVVRDNIDSWIAGGFADEFDIAVVASDYMAEPAYAVRVDAYRGLPVFRIATPREVNMDWRPLNPRMGELFGGILDLWRPDLVHFHATQQLTASCLQACQAGDIPYVVTAHDAWWISDWQFLVNAEGQLQEPRAQLIDPTSTGITPEQSLKRKALLGDALHKAEAVLAVSEAFAAIYRQVGISETIAVPNGTPHITRLPRRPSASGRVRLGHMGGMTVHKGYHLIYAALQQGEFSNLELTIVDHERSSGEERQLWGSTPVRIIAQVPQSQMPSLYADMDVLLAPSTWPESFGLVAREALAAGLWVVASDLGAMSEDIDPGVNGFRIDVSNAEGLKEALTQISAHPTRYLASPRRAHTARSTDDQARDLIAIYKDILVRRAGPEVSAVARLGPETVG